MTRTDDILDKQSEIASHQSHFNLALVFVTAFLVLIYALNGLLSFSGCSRIVFGFIVGIMILVLSVLILFMVRKKYPKKIWNKLILAK